jgi:Tol biopolymer transport system component/predicted Ser/Thr protein kinase
MALASGTKLGPYDLQSLLGAGGMGEVYRARDTRLNRVVAIKVLPATFSADAARLQRFMQEARSAAALNHPNILSIFDIGEDRGAPYIVSELLEGQTLRERIRSGPLSSRKAIDYALQVARGLAAAHEKGIVHRDLKPENLFITNDERVKILDFGLAKLTRPEGDVGEDAPTVQVNTEPGQIMGTVGYMSPEQVRGKPADHRSDIFAFGSILYEMLSGQPAFRGESPADTMSAILKEEPAELSETVRNVPPALERMVLHCLEKNPAQRFQSAGDLAFNLEALTDGSVVGKSGTQSAIASTGIAGPAVAETPAREKETASRSVAREVVGAVVLAVLMLGVGWWWGRGTRRTILPEYQPITFRTGSIGNARFTPDGSIVYSASWDGGESQLYMGRTDDPGARELGVKDAELLAISKSGELAVRLGSVVRGGFAQTGTLARLPMSGGAPREVLDNVEDADWAPDGESMAVVRYMPENQHWRLEYPIGKALLDGTNWISHPRISPDGKWIAFADHQNAVGDDEGAVAVIGSGGNSSNNKEKILSGVWTSLEGILWSPAGDEIWFTSTGVGSGANPRAVSLSGKVRTITNVPGGMWLQDRHNETVLVVTHRRRIGIRGIPPGGKEERELGWLDWSILGDLSRDGRKILFEEAGDGGGANYTVFVRDSDGSPPVRIGEGVGLTISPDGKWVITQPAKGGPLSLVPTGVGEARQLTHDKVSYEKARWLPGGKELLASGVEPGHGARDYLIAVSNGDSKPITPEGVVGVESSPDGRSAAVLDPDGKWGIWPIEPPNSGEGNGQRLIPGLDSNYRVRWSPDGTSMLALPIRQSDKTGNVYRVNMATGKMELVSTIGTGLTAGAMSIGGSYLLEDGGAYAYGYMQTLSQVFVIRGMK